MQHRLHAATGVTLPHWVAVQSVLADEHTGWTPTTCFFRAGKRPGVHQKEQAAAGAAQPHWLAARFGLADEHKGRAPTSCTSTGAGGQLPGQLQWAAPLLPAAPSCRAHGPLLVHRQPGPPSGLPSPRMPGQPGGWRDAWPAGCRAGASSAPQKGCGCDGQVP